ncbi:MAG: tRNA (N6-threonylcarbamoyladenosine(37)-N6)-methyltransferase TrmO [Candidatus Aminicenantes bacterium]|jgi:tRNA-Thr(GGU) m(6)t(6)A37 methyltransferase TsaA
MKFKLKPIGVVHSPFKKTEDIDSKKYADSGGFDTVQGELEIFPEFEEGLKDIEGFSHLIVLFVFHKSEGYSLHTQPLLDDTLKGVFSTRSPHRPNPVGMTVVKMLEREKNCITVSGIDMIEGTPILDIKPYTSRDQKAEVKLGWLKSKTKK